MKKRIRIIGMILAHVGLLLSIVYLVIFLVCTAKVSATSKPDAEISQTDLYLKQALDSRDFSFFTVGKALSEDSDAGRENLLIAADLIVPVLCLASGVLLQIGATHPRRKRPIQPQRTPSQSSNLRR